MARHAFGGDVAAWTFTVGSGDTAVLTGGATITFFDAQVGGTQYTDLSSDAAGTTITDHILSGTGAGGTVVGSIPLFYGPDTVKRMWASANGGARALMLAVDVPTYLDLVTTTATTTAADLTAHKAGINPHSTGISDLVDTQVSTATAGQVLAFNATANTWDATTVAGVGGTVTLAGAQTITGPKTFNTGTVEDSRIIVRASTNQVADILMCQNAAGQRTGYFNEKGELRAISAAANSVTFRCKGVSGQTALITEWTDINNNPIAWVEPDGRVRAPNLGHIMPFSIGGTLTVGTGKHRLYNDTGASLLIRSVRASVGTAPTGASLIVDVNRNGTTIFTTQAGRPTIAAAANTARVTGMDVTALADGDYLTIDVDQIGAGSAGADLTVQVLAY